MRGRHRFSMAGRPVDAFIARVVPIFRIPHAIDLERFFFSAERTTGGRVLRLQNRPMSQAEISAIVSVVGRSVARPAAGADERVTEEALIGLPGTSALSLPGQQQPVEFRDVKHTNIEKHNELSSSSSASHVIH
jgi:hypothetical protein